MKVLVLGSGGREHAIVDALVRSALVDHVWAAPGNGGTAAIAENVAELAIEDGAAVAAWAAANSADLVVIGPEAPLCAGVADSVTAAGIKVFGPGAQGAALEGSKTFAKQLMARWDIPCGRGMSFTDEPAALAYVREHGAPVVVKADGLAAGKGVTVAMDVADAEAAVSECFSGRFGQAGATVLVEEYLSGPEVSLLAFTDGLEIAVLAPAQDHKRALDGDEGPNTGGMGVYSPVPIVTPELHAQMTGILRRTVAALKSEGIVYQGMLYGGFILTDEGPKVLEYNARFGDPETQVLLPLLETDLATVMMAVAERRLGSVDLVFSEDRAVSVVLASGGYPGDYETGKVISGIEAAELIPGVSVYHAGTAMNGDDEFVTAGGRVLNVTAVAPTFAEARDLAYEACGRIWFEGMQYRRDIGLRALAQEL
jgi:phosphoribosylamine--glycine ligase